MVSLKAPSAIATPVADKRPFSQTHHGVTLHDDYYWLRADNWQEAMREPEKLPDDIKAYLNAENAYYDAAMDDAKSLQKELVAEMRGRIKEDDTSVPQKDGPYFYNTRFDTGSEHPIFVRRTSETGADEVLLDANMEASGKDYFELGAMGRSPDHSLLAWAVDVNGSEFHECYIRDLSSGKDLDYSIKDVGSVAFGDNETLFYSLVDEHHRPSKIYRHTVGSDPASDVLVREETDPRFFMGVGTFRSKKFVVISTGMNDQDEYWVIPTDDLSAEPHVIEPRSEGLEYSVDHQINDDGERFIIVTNADGAEDFKIVTAPVDTPDRSHWSDLVPAKTGRMVLDADCYMDWVFWLERENALPRIQIMNRAGEIHAIAFDEEAYGIGMAGQPDYDNETLRFVYSSPTTPSQVFDYDLPTRSRVLRKETEIPSGHDASDYIARRLMAPAHDGEEIPVTLLYHKDTELDGTAPCFLYGYGSYGHSMPAGFSSARLSLVDRGFIYAIAHVRGGEEKGRAWYESAKFADKMNSFHDFISVGQFLVEERLTAKGKIVCEGRSAGGLLVGAAANMAPELFGGVIAGVPFVDVLNTILDDTLPLTPGEWSQWGNPIESKEAFDWIAAYSPYDNVKAKAYPPMLVTAGVSDPRVTYWEPAKWVAKLRDLKTDDNLLLFRTNMTSGHFGKSGRFAALDDDARSFAFAIKATGGNVAV